MENYTREYTNLNSLIEEGNNEIIVQVIIGLFISFAVIHAAFKTWNNCNRNANRTFNARTIYWFIINCIETIGNYLFFIISIICIYIFVVYKGQTVNYLSLPDENKERVIKIFTIISFAAKVVEIITLMCHHRNINISFIDWEQPRKIFNSIDINRSSQTHATTASLMKFPVSKYNSHEQCSKLTSMTYERIQVQQNSKLSSNFNHDNITSSCQLNNDSNINVDSSSKGFSSSCMNIPSDEHNTLTSNLSSISTWRTCFVANQWLKIKTKRKTNVTLRIIAIIFIIEVIGLKFWSLAVSKWTIIYEANSQIKENYTLKYAIAIGVFTFVYCLQWFTYLLYGIYARNCLQEFIDLCSVANISIFILSHDYLGYYIHGRSVHGFSDKDLVSIINDLEREENNQCAHRGLVPGTHDQMFIVAASKSFRSYYDAIIMNDNNDNLNNKFSRRFRSDKQSWNEQWRTQFKLHEFFCSYLDHCLRNVDYTVQEKCFIEKLCDTEFADTNETSIFYIDKNYSFNKTIFYGNEWALTSFELVTFQFVLTLGGNWITCSVVTIFLSNLIGYISHIDQKKQLSAKTLIDRRFFI